MVERWNEVGEGVFVRRHRSLDLNIGAIVCDTGVAIVDTRAMPSHAAELRDSLRKVTRLPVRWVINTHHHWDHTFGNQVFTGAERWGHERCADAMRQYGEVMRAEVKRLAPQHAADLDRVEITPPDHLFPDKVELTLGDRTVELRHLGRGHTDNDIVVIVPGTDVVFAGDLIEQGAPPSFGDSYPLDWPDTVERLWNLCGPVVVPGHGAVVDASFVAGQLDELQIVARLARERHALGMEPAAAAAMSGPYTPEILAGAFDRAWRQLETA